MFQISRKDLCEHRGCRDEVQWVVWSHVVWSSALKASGSFKPANYQTLATSLPVCSEFFKKKFLSHHVLRFHILSKYHRMDIWGSVLWTSCAGEDTVAAWFFYWEAGGRCSDRPQPVLIPEKPIQSPFSTQVGSDVTLHTQAEGRSVCDLLLVYRGLLGGRWVLIDA